MQADPSAPAASQLRLVVGLGNPGRRYARTRHNIGFMVVDEVVRRAGESWLGDRSLNSEVARLGSLRLLKPQTYMNESGRAVAALSRFHQWQPPQLLVVYDDVSLPLGRLRLRASGSAGGHNGMRSIIQHLGSDGFPRLRVGIGEGRRSTGEGLTDHVLGDFTEAEEIDRSEAVDRAADAIETVLQRGWEAAMNEFNIPPARATPPPQSSGGRPAPGPA